MGGERWVGVMSVLGACSKADRQEPPHTHTSDRQTDRLHTQAHRHIKSACLSACRYPLSVSLSPCLHSLHPLARHAAHEGIRHESIWTGKVGALVACR